MKNIVVNIRRERDFYVKYGNGVSTELLEYLIEEAKLYKDVEVTVNTKLDIKNIETLIKKGLEELSNDNKIIDDFFNRKQVSLFVIGIIFLIISAFTKFEIIKELILIIAWIAVWEVLDITINIDSKQRRKKKAIKKLLNCKIKVNNN